MKESILLLGLVAGTLGVVYLTQRIFGRTGEARYWLLLIVGAGGLGAFTLVVWNASLTLGNLVAGAAYGCIVGLTWGQKNTGQTYFWEFFSQGIWDIIGFNLFLYCIFAFVSTCSNCM